MVDGHDLQPVNIMSSIKSVKIAFKIYKLYIVFIMLDDEVVGSIFFLYEKQK